MSLLSQKFKFLRKKNVSPSGHQITEDGGREWENFYRDRWSYDKVVRTTHGVNCTGSCSWNIYVKNGCCSVGKIRRLITLKHQMICRITNHVDALVVQHSLGISIAHYA